MVKKLTFFCWRDNAIIFRVSPISLIAITRVDSFVYFSDFENIISEIPSVPILQNQGRNLKNTRGLALHCCDACIAQIWKIDKTIYACNCYQRKSETLKIIKFSLKQKKCVFWPFFSFIDFCIVSCEAKFLTLYIQGISY